MGKIIVVGHGYDKGQMTLEAVSLLRSGAKVLLHTARCGCAEWLMEEGIGFEALDDLYETCEDFDEHAEAAADAVCDAADEGDVVYGVFDVRDRSVTELLSRRGDVRIVAGPPVEGALLAFASGAVQLLEASDWEEYALTSARSALVRELDSRELAGEVKLKLMETYPEESRVYVRIGDGVAQTELYNLDRLKGYDHRTCVLVPAEPELRKLERFDFERLKEIISILCGPNGCPWDREQTHQSLRSYIIEEAYEVVEAIDEDDPFHLYDELGDMLLQVVLHAEIGKRYGEFDMSDVVTAISEKMISRHSHIFGSDRAADAEEVLDIWNRNKMAERGQTTRTATMRGVTRTLPAALRAVKVLKRLDEACRRREKPGEAIKEAVRSAASAGESEEALGEALLRMAAVARAAKLDPEIALNAAVDRLIQRFDALESELTATGGSIDSASDELLGKYWDLVKLSNIEA